MAWTSSTDTVDSLIRDYLRHRGFNATVRAFDNELKNDKEKGFKAEKIVQQLLSYINVCDVDSLRSYWSHLDSKIFCRFEQQQLNTVKRMEFNLYKLYLVNCMQNGKRKECFDFFEKFSQELLNHSEWKDWFTFPFITQPEINKSFSNYFTKAWTDTFLVSLQNFFAVTFACMPSPHLFHVIEQDKIKIEQLERKIEQLKAKLSDVTPSVVPARKPSTPNYVKSLGTPGSLTENPPVVVQPPKKKTLGFSFSTKKNSAPASKQKGSPKVSARSLDANNATSDPVLPSASHPEKQDTNPKSKKLSGYQQQRKELFGGSSGLPKHKNQPLKELMSSSPPVSSPTVASNPQSDLMSSSNTSLSNANSITSINSVVPTNKMRDLNKEEVPSAPSTDKETGNSMHVTNNTKITEPPKEEQLKQHVPLKTSDGTHIVLSKDEYQEHHSAIVQGKFNSTGETVASCDKDGIVKIWKYEPKPSTVATVMSRSPFLSLDWCKSSNSLLFLGSSSGTMRLYNSATKQVRQDVNLSSKHPHVMQISCSNDGNSLATSSVCQSHVPEWDSNSTAYPQYSSCRVEIWKLAESAVEPLNILYESKSCDIRCVSFDLKDNILFCGTSNGDILAIDVRSGRTVSSCSAHDGPVYTLEVVGENSLFTLGADGKFQCLNTSKMNEPVSLPIHTAAAGPFEVSGFGGYRQVHKPSGGKLFAFEPEGNHLLTCDGSTSVIYDVDVGLSQLKKKQTLIGHRSPVVSVDWVSNVNCGHCLSGSMDGKIHVTTLLKQ